MATKIVVSALCCDQGMGTLVKIYDMVKDKEKLAHLALLDLGCESETKANATKAVDSVIDALKEMVKPPTIDLIVVSHQDEDHWNLLPTLKNRIDLEDDLKNVTTVKQMKYGGSGTWGRTAKDSIRRFAKALKVKALALPLNQSNYTLPPPKKPVRINPIAGVEFKLLCTGVSIPPIGKQTAASMKKTPQAKNAASAVVVIGFAGVKVVVPGDATADTIGWINTNIFEEWEAKKSENPVETCRVLCAPHHGSHATIANDYASKKRKAEARETPQSIGDRFARYVSAENVVASAGYKSRHRHPSKSVMLQLAVDAVDDAADHPWVWYVDGDDWAKEPNKDTGYSTDKRGIWTTIISLGGPPNTDEPKFTITSLGEVFFEWGQVEITPPYERFDRYAATPHER